METPAIKIENLIKYYDGRKILDGIDLHIPKGCIYGLLGRNGIGKTTIIRTLLGLEKPTRGRTSILGEDSGKLSAKTKSKIGYVAEGHNLIQDYSVDKLVSLYKGLSSIWDDGLFNELMTRFRLPLNRKVKELSTGMRAQLNLILAMSISPEVLILDDPTLGLDTVVRREFLELAIELIQRDGRTILFSSHILSDVERIADCIGILVAGDLVVDCELEDLKRRVRKVQLIFDSDPPDDLHLTEIIKEKRSGRELVVTVVNWSPQKRAVIETFKPTTINEIPMSLEDLFIECTHIQNGKGD
ncbi:MAG: ABC transporter ATP-binding protein [Anaerohalosphaeraceae bacterium]|nr:ABC transporter ATP-binding protein [Anaerohalosphaeraceae bacterium]